MRRIIGAISAVAALGAQPTPGPDAREARFVATGTPADPPRIVADFNGWTGGTMTPSADGRTFTLRVALDPAARIEYLIAYRDRFELDPGNPLTVPAPAGPPRSELRMPEYREPAALPTPRRRGTIEELAFTSRDGLRRRIRVYVPPMDVGPAEAGPSVLPSPPEGGRHVLYAYDGDVVLDKLELPAVLDSLIDSRGMAPAIAVFIDSVDRHDDYEPGATFRRVFVDEIVPMIERRYPSAGARRALLGLSRSTVGALDTCVNGGIRVDACLLVAPAIPPAQFSALLARAGTPTRFALATGTYDIPLVADARRLRDEMQRRGLAVDYAERPQGHNHTAFRAALPDLLRGLFADR